VNLLKTDEERKELRMRAVLLLALLLIAVPSTAFPALPVSYDIVYVRAARLGNNIQVELPEVKDPIQVPPGADLMLLHPNGSEEVLVPGGNGAVVDPFVSFDGKWVYYAKFPDTTASALSQRKNAPKAGADIFKINLTTRQIMQLTFQEWTPNTGLVNWSTTPLRATPPNSYYLGYGIFNLGPTPLPGGKIMFSSSRNGFLPNKEFTFPNLQLFVMDDDGSNVEQVGHLNLGSALHPNILTDGRVMFASYEGQGVRDRRLWGLWSIWPDGRHWEPLMSAFAQETSFHFQAELSNHSLAVVGYYNQNNNGFGTLLAFPPSPPPGAPAFGDPNPRDPSNPVVRRNISQKKQYAFSPYGLYSLTPFAHEGDNAAAKDAQKKWVGKVTHPSGAPNNDVLVVWSPGPANDLKRPTNRPTFDAGLYLLRGGVPVEHPDNLVLLKNSPKFNDLQPRAVVPYRAIYGIDEPVRLPWNQNDGSAHVALPAGTPFGLVGTSSFYKRNTSPGSQPRSAEAFGSSEPFYNGADGRGNPNWFRQGADAGRYQNSDIYAVRLLAMEPSSHVSYGPGVGPATRGFFNHAQERLRILGEIPLRKFDSNGVPILDADGNPDTSFLALVPADTPFTFQTLDKDGLVLNMAQTWHQVRPGEVRNDCGGCHAHAQLPTPFVTTAAAQPGYQIRNLALRTPLLSKDDAGQPTIVEHTERAVDVEYYRDIKPILQRSCVGCHSGTAPAAQLNLGDTSIVSGYENTYNILARNEAITGVPPGIPPLEGNGKTPRWVGLNASRYIRMFQSRRSLLVWKIFGRRLDGWTNDDHPTEIIPGDPKTLPLGTKTIQADIDYTGTSMPPPGSGSPPLSEDEKLLFARWIDLGAPISSQDGLLAQIGWFADDLRPTLTVSAPQAGRSTAPLSRIQLGAFDYYSGLDHASLSVKADFAVNGQAPGIELASFFQETGDSIWTLPLTPAITTLTKGKLTVSVKDLRGNLTQIERTFSIGSAS
jgi:hypothetical protein